MAEQKPQEHRGKSQTSGASSIVRVAGRDVDGSLNIERALSNVKGVGMNMSHALALVIESKLNIPKTTEIGSLSETQIAEVEGVIKDPVSAGIPSYMINRNKDMETGKDMHVVGNDLIFNTRQDISRDVANKTWRGYRHQYGQKVRGQATRSTGRTGITVGVTKKSIVAAGKAAKGGPAGKDAKPAEKGKK
ncbi:MAG: 30S ribosomal protein S13 [Candidatus Micrarchaeaceae archaeon]|nr:30S ribosomal protein S13 [Candidatus Micrarchaeota archaeon]HII10367.1 30S ribosomal protein S13 [Candidatus Micrarchaeota archaeon]